MQTTKDKIISFTGVLLFTAMIGLTVYALKEQKDIYESLTKSTNLMIHSTQEQAGLYQNFRELNRKSEAEIARISQDLINTQQVLRNTQTLLAEVQKTNSLLQEQMASNSKASADQGASAAPGNSAKADFSDIRNETESLNAEKVAGIEEGHLMIASLKDKIQSVKIRMRALKREAFLARIAAQKEEDRLALERGNRGFLVKGGEVKTAEDIETATGQKVDINVQFYEQ